MGLFDIAQELLGGSQAGSAGSMVGSILQALNGQAGGLDGVLQSLQQGGLGDAVKSWIGTGGNLPVSAEQIQSVLGSGAVQDLARNWVSHPPTPRLTCRRCFRASSITLHRMAKCPRADSPALGWTW